MSPPPERRRRGDVVAAAAVALVLLVVAGAYWRASPAATTVSVTAASPLLAPPAAERVPAGFVPAWQAPSAATPGPVVAGPAVVTADGSAVFGRDARTGAVAWSYRRDLPLCTAAAGFPTLDAGVGRVLALFRVGDWCSELTTLRPDTGERAAQRNPDARPGTRVLANGGLVALTGSDHAEVLRSPDLVRTLEYGTIPAPEQPNQQPRPGCAYGSFGFAGERLAVVERCPGEHTDRLTVLLAGGDSAEKPRERFSMPLPGTAAVLVAHSHRRTAVALPGPPRLLLFDETGAVTATVALPVAAPADPPGGVAPVATDGARHYWWTGSATVALDPVTLEPTWTLRGTLGPGVPYAGALLVPVPDGLAEVDPATGAVHRTIPVQRPDREAPVALAAAGEVLLEQRGPEIAALLPSN